jgi:hypothetical protein
MLLTVATVGQVGAAGMGTRLHRLMWHGVFLP